MKRRSATLQEIVEETGKQFNSALHHMRYGGFYENGRYRAPEQPEVSARTVRAALLKRGIICPKDEERDD